MGRRSRYIAYVNGVAVLQKKKSTRGSILKKLQELKEQKAVISIPVGEAEDEK